MGTPGMYEICDIAEQVGVSCTLDKNIEYTSVTADSVKNQIKNPVGTVCSEQHPKS